ncbi:MAG: hypothetical protein Q7S82_01610 [bacterium]|nr:hypothetical protein [bacterium]
MAVLRVLSSAGDKTICWDPAKVESGDPEALAAVLEAERIFAQERSRGAVAFRVEPGIPAERIDVFEQDAKETIIVPRIAGG